MLHVWTEKSSTKFESFKTFQDSFDVQFTEHNQELQTEFSQVAKIN